MRRRIGALWILIGLVMALTVAVFLAYWVSPARRWLAAQRPAAFQVGRTESVQGDRLPSPERGNPDAEHGVARPRRQRFGFGEATDVVGSRPAPSAQSASGGSSAAEEGTGPDRLGGGGSSPTHGSLDRGEPPKTVLTIGGVPIEVEAGKKYRIVFPPEFGTPNPRPRTPAEERFWQETWAAIRNAASVSEKARLIRRLLPLANETELPAQAETIVYWVPPGAEDRYSEPPDSEAIVIDLR